MIDLAKVDSFRRDNGPLIEAIVSVESGGDVFASRVEINYAKGTGYKWLWNVEADVPMKYSRLALPAGFKGCGLQTATTELTHQRTSWGPMQIMGAVAREYGFRGALAELCGEFGVVMGVWHLIQIKNRIARRGHHSRDDLIAAYNYGHVRCVAGTGQYANQRYVDKVNAALLEAG